MKDSQFKVLLLALALCTVCILRWGTPAEQASSMDYSQLSDALVDSGFGLPVDGEDSLAMMSRDIVMTTDVNAHFSRALIRQFLYLDRLEPGKAINLYLRTEGGWEADAFAVIDTMRHLRSPVNVYGMGEVHSAGVMILASATGERNVYANTILGFHALGSDEEELYERRYLSLWERFSHLPPEWLARRDEEMVYFSAKDALKYKVADTVVEEPDRQLGK